MGGILLQNGSFATETPGRSRALTANLSDSEPYVAIIARTDPNGQGSVALLPELDGIIA